ncbi:S-phase kinase-associated protein 1-like [Sesbania bispinosa]|nr:S-phase kinase-associated protein 1-like [Sesbania bispinosa]
MASSSKKMIVKCSEDEILEVEEALVNASQTLKRLIGDNESRGEKVIILPDISRETLSMINNYVKKHADANAELAVGKASKGHKKSLHVWDTEFMKVDQDTLYKLIMAAQYLKIEDLLDLGCQTVANMIKGKSPDNIREMFNIKNDFTPEEEEENQRCFP